MCRAQTEFPRSYAGARYYHSQTGRFTSPDPLGASAKLRNPQTFNRYAYALNNPLRFIDPSGLDVDAACVEDPKCTIVVKINVIYDKRSRLSPDDKRKFEEAQLARAKEMYGKSNIELRFTYVQEGEVKSQGGLRISSGLDKNALNLAVTNQVLNAVSGYQDGVAVAFVNPKLTSTVNTFHTTSHEIGHHFLGHVDYQKSANIFLGMAQNAIYDTFVNSRLLFQDWGRQQSGFRTGLQPRVYAIPLSAAVTKPEQ